MCRAELIPTEAQIQAATTLDARASSTSTAVEGEGFCALACGDLYNKNRGRGDGSGALERLAERGPRVHI